MNKAHNLSIKKGMCIDMNEDKEGVILRQNSVSVTEKTFASVVL